MRSVNPTIELVVARFNENLAWLHDVPKHICITVYNKGTELTALPKRTVVVQLPNIGRESHTIALHCAAMRACIADYTVFAQGDPFKHSPYFLELLHNCSTELCCEPFSCKYLGDIPPSYIQAMSENRKVRSEKVNLYTLDSMAFRDAGTQGFYERYLEVFNLARGQSVMHHFFTTLGLENHLEPNQESGLFAYGAIFGVDKAHILAHDESVFVNLIQLSIKDWSIGYVIERSWLLLFK